MKINSRIQLIKDYTRNKETESKKRRPKLKSKMRNYRGESTKRLEMEPRPMVRKRPKYESEMKAPKRGIKFVAAFQRKIVVVAWATPM